MYSVHVCLYICVCIFLRLLSVFFLTQEQVSALRQSLDELVFSVIATHAEDDLIPWLDQASLTLTTSSTIPRVPTFLIKLIAGLQENNSGVAKLLEWTEETWKLFDFVKTLIDRSAPSQSMCAQLSKWEASCKALWHLVPSLEAKLVPIKCSLQRLAEEFYTSKMHTAMQQASKLVVAASNKAPLPQASVEASLVNCDEAKLLATGHECPHKKASALKFVATARNLLAYSAAMQRKEMTQAMASYMNLVRSFEFSIINEADLNVDSVAIKSEEHLALLGKVCTLLFGPPDSPTLPSLTLEQFKEYTVPQLLFS